MFNVLQRNASQVGAMDIGYQPGTDEVFASKPKVLFLLGADGPTITRDNIPKDCFVIYQGEYFNFYTNDIDVIFAIFFPLQGHHGDAGAAIADIILPGAAYTEKQGTYVNTEGRAQQTLVAVTPPGLAREDWKILRALAEVLGKPLAYDTLDELRTRIEKISPHLTNYGKRDGSDTTKDKIAAVSVVCHTIPIVGGRFCFAKIGVLQSGQIQSSKIDIKQKELKDYFMTDPISRSSPTMAKCIAAVKKQEANPYK